MSVAEAAGFPPVPLSVVWHQLQEGTSTILVDVIRNPLDTLAKRPAQSGAHR